MTLVEYQYDAYGNILHVIDTSGSLGLSTINPYTYRGYRYDVELFYYYCNARYYQPLIGRWLNADHVGFLDPEGVSGLNLFAYGVNNPVTHAFYNSPTVILSSSTIHFANIIASDSSGNSFWSIVWDWMNTIYGFLNPVSKLTFEYTIIVAMINGRWEDLEEDWDNGCFNPFNQDASTALKANVASFYKGSTVVREGFIGSCSILGTIWNDGGLNTTDLNHEWGHSIQERILGPSYLALVAAPSAINCMYGRYRKYNNPQSDMIYYSKVWERSADWLGGVSRNYYPFFTFDNFIPW